MDAPVATADDDPADSIVLRLDDSDAVSLCIDPQLTPPNCERRSPTSDSSTTRWTRSSSMNSRRSADTRIEWQIRRSTLHDPKQTHHISTRTWQSPTYDVLVRSHVCKCGATDSHERQLCITQLLTFQINATASGLRSTCTRTTRQSSSRNNGRRIVPALRSVLVPRTEKMIPPALLYIGYPHSRRSNRSASAPHSHDREVRAVLDQTPILQVLHSCSQLPRLK